MLKQDCLHGQLKSRPDDINLEQNYKAVMNKVVSEIGKSKCKNNKNLDASLSSNIGSKKWSKMTKILTNDHVNNLNNTPLLDGNSLITDDYARANMFNNCFVSQATLDDSQNQLAYDEINPEVLIEQHIILPEEVYDILVKLDISKSTVPDGISNKLLCEAVVPISELLCHLLNYYLSTGYFPEAWKTAHAIPIHKKDNHMLCNTYRPISLLCWISKVFEKLLFNHIYNFLKANGLLKINLSGFTPGDRTIDQLINISNKIHC